MEDPNCPLLLLGFKAPFERLGSCGSYPYGVCPAYGGGTDRRMTKGSSCVERIYPPTAD